jgi:hypothetical protein
MRKLIVLLVLLALNGGIALSQSANQVTKAKPKLTITRIHIDGFQKSKSGAI